MTKPLTPDFSIKPFKIYCGDALDVVSRLRIPVDCVVTSPPYFHQRKYGDDGAELGQEKKVSEFVDSLVTIFKSIKLEPWGSLWINIGNKRGKNGELLGVGSRFVIAMQDAGFYLMDDVIWTKETVSVDGSSLGHCMVEPAVNRLNGNGWESFFHFVLDPELAWSDTCAVRIPRDPTSFFHEGTQEPIAQPPYKDTMQCVTSETGRNLTNVWYVGSSRNESNHFAAYPEALVERPIAMNCPEWLVETKEGLVPKSRILKSVTYTERKKRNRVFGQYTLTESQPDETKLSAKNQDRLKKLRNKSGRRDTARHYVPKYPQTIGWTHDDKSVTRAGIVLDPFGGTGTTGAVAIKLGRCFIGVDLYQDCADRMQERCQKAYTTCKEQARKKSAAV